MPRWNAARRLLQHSERHTAPAVLPTASGRPDWRYLEHAPLYRGLGRQCRNVGRLPVHNFIHPRAATTPFEPREPAQAPLRIHNHTQTSTRQAAPERNGHLFPFAGALSSSSVVSQVMHWVGDFARSTSTLTEVGVLHEPHVLILHLVPSLAHPRALLCALCSVLCFLVSGFSGERLIRFSDGQ